MIPHVAHDSFRHSPPPQVTPPLPTPGVKPHQSQYHAGYVPGEKVDGSGQDSATGVPNLSGTGSGNLIRPPTGPPPPSGGGDGWGYVPSQGNPGGGAGPPGGGGGDGLCGESGPPNPNPGGLLPPDDRAGNAPNPDDVDCERCGCRTTRARARTCVSCRFRCCPNCCRDPLNICRVCAERATGIPPNQAAQNPGGNQGDGGGDRKAKCKPLKLDPEPEPSRLRRWIVDMKEKVANAFSHDIQFAMQWVEIPDDATYDALAAECRYGMLENELNSALRESIKAVALRNKIQAETERMHTLGRRLMSRQILWVMYDHLRPHIAGDNTFKIIELTKMSIDRVTRGCEAERLEAFMDRWDHNLADIAQARPPDDMLCALLYEQVRGMKCLELDMHLWNRDETVRNYAFLRNSVATAVANWRLRDNAERMYPRLLDLCLRDMQPLLRARDAQAGLRDRMRLDEEERKLLLEGITPRRLSGASPAIGTRLHPQDTAVRRGRALVDLRLDHPVVDLCARSTSLEDVTGVLTVSSRTLVTPVGVPIVEVDPCLRSRRNLEFVSITLEVNAQETNALTSMRSLLPRPNPLRLRSRRVLPAEQTALPQLLRIFRWGGPLP